MSNMDIQKLMDLISKRLEEAKEYGLETEVVAWALQSLNGDLNKCADAIEAGFDEWVK